MDNLCEGNWLFLLKIDKASHLGGFKLHCHNLDHESIAEDDNNYTDFTQKK